MYFVSPEQDDLTLDCELRGRLESAGVEVHEVHSLEASINGEPLLESIDCLYMTRIQREHNSPETEAEIQAMLGPRLAALEARNRELEAMLAQAMKD